MYSCKQCLTQQKYVNSLFPSKKDLPPSQQSNLLAVSGLISQKLSQIMTTVEQDAATNLLKSADKSVEYVINIRNLLARLTSLESSLHPIAQRLENLLDKSGLQIGAECLSPPISPTPLTLRSVSPKTDHRIILKKIGEDTGTFYHSLSTGIEPTSGRVLINPRSPLVSSHALESGKLETLNRRFKKDKRRPEKEDTVSVSGCDFLLNSKSKSANLKFNNDTSLLPSEELISSKLEKNVDYESMQQKLPKSTSNIVSQKKSYIDGPVLDYILRKPTNRPTQNLPSFGSKFELKKVNSSLQNLSVEKDQKNKDLQSEQLIEGPAFAKNIKRLPHLIQISLNQAALQHPASFDTQKTQNVRSSQTLFTPQISAKQHNLQWPIRGVALPAHKDPTQTSTKLRTTPINSTKGGVSLQSSPINLPKTPTHEESVESSEDEVEADPLPPSDQFIPVKANPLHSTKYDTLSGRSNDKLGLAVTGRRSIPEPEEEMIQVGRAMNMDRVKSNMTISERASLFEHTSINHDTSVNIRENPASNSHLALLPIPPNHLVNEVTRKALPRLTVPKNSNTHLLPRSSKATPTIKLMMAHGEDPDSQLYFPSEMLPTQNLQPGRLSTNKRTSTVHSVSVRPRLVSQISIYSYHDMEGSVQPVHMDFSSGEALPRSKSYLVVDDGDDEQFEVKDFEDNFSWPLSFKFGAKVNTNKSTAHELGYLPNLGSSWSLMEGFGASYSLTTITSIEFWTSSQGICQLAIGYIVFNSTHGQESTLKKTFGKCTNESESQRSLLVIPDGVYIESVYCQLVDTHINLLKFTLSDSTVFTSSDEQYIERASVHHSMFSQMDRLKDVRGGFGMGGGLCEIEFVFERRLVGAWDVI
jgi:hypothetical protein